jgi:hypothetical protein
MRLHISNVGHIVPVKSRALQGGGGEPLTLNKAPIAIEAVERIDALFAIERDINGKPPPQRRSCASCLSSPATN